MKYWKFIDSCSPKRLDRWLGGQEELVEGQGGVPEGEENMNFEEKFCTALEKYAVELDNHRNVTPISKLVLASLNDLMWDCFTGKCSTRNMTSCNGQKKKVRQHSKKSGKIMGKSTHRQRKLPEKLIG